MFHLLLRSNITRHFQLSVSTTILRNTSIRIGLKNHLMNTLKRDFAKSRCFHDQFFYCDVQVLRNGHRNAASANELSTSLFSLPASSSSPASGVFAGLKLPAAQLQDGDTLNPAKSEWVGASVDSLHLALLEGRGCSCPVSLTPRKEKKRKETHKFPLSASPAGWVPSVSLVR